MLTDKELLVDSINGRLVCLRGIGRVYYESGFPIPMGVEYMKKKGIEVSILHIADELLKNGFSSRGAITAITDGAISEDAIDVDELKEFCDASYERQREMLFNYLFDGNMESVKAFFKTRPELLEN